MNPPETVPLYLITTPVKNEWIDYNGHMNVAYYVVAFDMAVDRLFQMLGLDENYLKHHNASSFTMEAHINYMAEVKLDDPLCIFARILDYDHKRMHVFLQMHHETEQYPAATMEALMIHVDMASRRSSPYPDSILERIRGVFEIHRGLPEPDNKGRVIGIRR